MKYLRVDSAKSICKSLIIILLISPATSTAEFQHYWGLEPQFSKEDWYTSNELNSNIVPVVYEVALDDQSGIRLRSHVFLHTGRTNTEDTISLVGIGAAWLWYWNPQTNYAPYHGFNFGPATTFSKDFLDEIDHRTVALEVGYTFAFTGGWVINAAVQTGRSSFSGGKYPDANHFGVYISAGSWN